MGGVPGFVGFGSRRFRKDWTVAVMESQREGGREVQRGEEGLMEWIRVLREDFEDFRVSFVAMDRNSCAED